MKKNAVPASTGLPKFWRSLALLSLAGNIALLAWVLVMAKRPKPQPAPPPVARAVAPARPLARTPHAALGSYLAENNRIADLGWNETQFGEFLEGVRASYEGRGLPLDEDAKQLRDEISRKVQSMLAQEQPGPVEEYFRTLREKEGARRTPSGLHYRITETGEGEAPKPGDVVVISFAARQPDGRSLPELTRARVKMPVRDLLPGLAEGVQLMRVGGKALVFLPPELAFRDSEWPAGIPKGMPLGFFVELHEVLGGGDPNGTR